MLTRQRFLRLLDEQPGVERKVLRALAKRLVSLSDSAVLVSAATQRLIQGYFACHDLGANTLKGTATPVSVYRVLGESGAQNRFEVAMARGLTPLVGRHGELELLLKLWEQVYAGQGQVVLLGGDEKGLHDRLRPNLARRNIGGSCLSLTKTADGRLWFPTAKGLVSVNPANVQTNALPPPIVCAARKALELVAQSTELRDRLHYNARTLRTGLERAGFTLTSEEKHNSFGHDLVAQNWDLRL